MMTIVPDDESTPLDSTTPSLTPTPNVVPPAPVTPPAASVAPSYAAPAASSTPSYAAAAAADAPHTPASPAADVPPPPTDDPQTIYVPAPAAKKRGKGGALVAAALVGALAGGLVGGAAGVGASVVLVRDALAQNPTGSGPGTITISNPEDVTAVTAIAATAGPSIVTISAQARIGGGSGSGIVISEDGYILTNTHVVTLEGATDNAAISVTTADGRILPAKIVGLDPLTDLAVIKVAAEAKLSPIEWASSSELNVGDRTVVIGAPLGLANSVSEGIVSALNRGIRIASSAVPEDTSTDEEPEFGFDIPGLPEPSTPRGMISIPVIQTDAAVNPGNSGGGLVDDEGRLIGVIVAIASTGGGETAGSIGVGFAIPSDVAKRVADELIENGTATHGLLGLTSMDSTSEAGILGAVVQDVQPGSAAAEAGIKSGDVITGVGGVPVTSSTDLTAQIRALAAGATTTISFVRAGATQTVEVTLGALE